MAYKERTAGKRRFAFTELMNLAEVRALPDCSEDFREWVKNKTGYIPDNWSMFVIIV